MSAVRKLFPCVLILMAVGCAKSDVPPEASSGDATTTGQSTAGTAKGSIGYSALTLTNPFFKVIADTMVADAQSHGYQMIVVSGDQDVKKQSDQIDDFIVRGMSAIVLNPCDSRSIGQAIRRANEAGIPVFTNDIKYDGTDATVECHIATDNAQGGRLAGEAMVRLLGESGGKVAVLHYPDVESCQLRVQGFIEVLDAHNSAPNAPQIQIVATLNGKGTRDAGFAAARDTIEANPDLSAIFAINDPSALGARAALEAASKADQVSIIAFDGQRIGKQAILDGKILCDPIQFPDQIGSKTIEMIVKFFEGEEIPSEVLIPSQLYYREDAEKDPELQKPNAE